MNRSSTIFLRGVIILIGTLIFAICVLGLPRIIDTFEPGGYDPILIGLYIPAIPFFFALYQAMKLLNHIDRNQAFSESSIASFRTIKYCALVISGLFAGGMPYIFYVADKDDAPGVVAMALVIIFASFVIATFAAVLQKLIQNAVDIKSENDLTV
jgi:hypothetical protein